MNKLRRSEWGNDLFWKSNKWHHFHMSEVVIGQKREPFLMRMTYMLLTTSSRDNYERVRVQPSDWLITVGNGSQSGHLTRIYWISRKKLLRSCLFLYLLGSYPAFVSISACSLVLGKPCITQPLVTASNWARRLCSNCKTKPSGTETSNTKHGVKRF